MYYSWLGALLTRVISKVDEMQWAWPFEEIRLNWLVETAYEGESQVRSLYRRSLPTRIKR